MLRTIFRVFPSHIYTDSEMSDSCTLGSRDTESDMDSESECSFDAAAFLDNLDRAEQTPSPTLDPRPVQAQLPRLAINLPLPPWAMEMNVALAEPAAGPVRRTNRFAARSAIRERVPTPYHRPPSPPASSPRYEPTSPQYYRRTPTPDPVRYTNEYVPHSPTFSELWDSAYVPEEEQVYDAAWLYERTPSPQSERTPSPQYDYDMGDVPPMPE
jgi:hypothetical protein